MCIRDSGYTLYHNDNYVPMGFTYDYYVTKATYEASVKTLRSNLLLRALVLELSLIHI